MLSRHQLLCYLILSITLHMLLRYVLDSISVYLIAVYLVSTLCQCLHIGHSLEQNQNFPIKNSQSLFAGNSEGELTVFLLKKPISYTDWTAMRRSLKKALI